MIEIGKTVVSLELFEEEFCCDLNKCKGECCVQGDSGAPLNEDELEQLEKVLPIIWDELSEECQAVINKQGVAYRDDDGDLVTSIVNNDECVFSYTDPEDGCVKCAIEKAHREGKTDFYKPISCHLYPVRLAEYRTFTAVNFHRWQVCNCAFKLGQKLKLPVYKFLKDPLIRKFGQDWYIELCEAADAYNKEFKPLK